MEGAEEWSFFKNYMPAGLAMQSGPPSGLTAAASAEERDAKTAGLGDTKGNGGRGKGSEAQRGNATGSGGSQQSLKRQQAGWSRQGGRKDSWFGDWGNDVDSNSNAEIREIQKVIGMMQRLVLRHEDSINLLKLEYSFVAHMRLNVPSSVAAMLYVAADGWRKLKASDPAKLDRPMRTSLFVCFFVELKERLKGLESRPEDVEKMAQMGWLVSGTPRTWQFLKWDAAAQRTVVDPSKPPLTQEEVVEHVDSLLSNVVASNSLARFHPTRPLAEDMQGESIAFLVQVGNMGEPAMTLRRSLKALCYNAALQLVATQLEEDRMVRSTLATNIASSIRS